MQWFDAGVNLLDRRFDADAVLAEAREAGVKRICMITTHPDEWEAAASLYAAHPQQLCYTVGVHPHNAKDVRPEHYTQLRSVAAAPGVVAIGECGLDFNRNFSPPNVQREVFREQLKLAVALGLPVYLHERDAFADQQTILNEFAADLSGGLAHCFTGDQATMQAYLDMGLHIGITGWVCDPKRGESLREAVKALPLDRLILETDAPYLFPKSLRPRKRNNTPATLPHIATQLAELLESSTAELSNTSYANSCDLFGLKR
ncbi:TatD family hydrolase [Alteromonas sp. ASW11-19]|uniref:TatD family hydrolase n=1 Tax=Alteromonas salexigens TaxID=2982530 RepID=A0ABT2VJ80_9ALTE|nr:TatD family hydrolase [Alteromonas salexigens]MCU7553265.1 TatD family hydrolase [Alteromonas salexigens]